MRWIFSVTACAACACCLLACSGEKSEGLASESDAGNRLDGGSAGLLDGSAAEEGGSNGSDAGINNSDAAGDAGRDAAVPAGDFERVAHIYAGWSHACALLVDGRVKCWGGNGNGQLGRGDDVSLGDDLDELGPMLKVVELGSNDISELALGYDFSCARFGNGSVKCWGGNQNGQLGQDRTDNLGDAAGEIALLAAIDLGVGRTALAIDAGFQTACALLDNGSVKCWGSNDSGQLGQGDLTSRGVSAGDMAALMPVNLGAGRTAKRLTLGYRHACAVRDDETMVCWGHNGFGQMGRGTTASPLDRVGDQSGEMGDALLPLSLGSGRTIQRMDSGNAHSCALLDNSKLKCWGNNFAGALGLGDQDNRGDNPSELGDALGVVGFATERTVLAFAIGENHGCARLDDGSAACWGGNASGELGIGDAVSRGATPGVIDKAPLLGTDRKVVELALGEEFTCALLDTERVKCWGDAGTGVPGFRSDDREVGDEPSELGDALEYIDLGKP